jgi:hypothetical protein
MQLRYCSAPSSTRMRVTTLRWVRTLNVIFLQSLHFQVCVALYHQERTPAWIISLKEEWEEWKVHFNCAGPSKGLFSSLSDSENWQIWHSLGGQEHWQQGRAWVAFWSTFSTIEIEASTAQHEQEDTLSGWRIKKVWHLSYFIFRDTWRTGLCFLSFFSDKKLAYFVAFYIGMNVEFLHRLKPP